MKLKRTIIVFLVLLSSICGELVKPELSYDNCFYVLSEYLCWQPNVDGLGYAIQMDSYTNKGRVKNLDFNYNSGFRLGMGYRIPHDKWTLFTNWTWFYGSSNNSAMMDVFGDLLYPEWAVEISPNSLTNSPITYIDAAWHMHLNTLDGAIGRFIKVSEFVFFTPFFGLRGAWINQQYRTNLTGGANGSTAVSEDHISMRSDFSGVGPRAGIDSEWQVWKNWSFYGSLSGALLYGSFHLMQKEVQVTVTTPSTQLYNIKDQINQVVGTCDCGLGLRWDDIFYEGLLGLRFQIGWEFNSYFQQDKFKHFNRTNGSVFSYEANHEDITTQGLTVSFRFDF